PEISVVMSCACTAALDPGRRREHVGARRLTVDAHRATGLVPVAGQEQLALNQGARGRLGVEPFAELVVPRLRQHPPLAISTFAVDVPEPVSDRSGARIQIRGVESGVAVPFEEATDLFDGRTDLSGIVPTVVMPSLEGFDGGVE